MLERIPKIIVVGPAYVEMAIKCEEHPSPGNQAEGSGFTCVPTGSGVNTSIQLALCGCDTYLLARVGQDCFGEMVRQSLRRYNISTDLVYSTNAMSTGIVVTLVDNRGENCSCRSCGANRVLGRDEIEYVGAEQIIGSSNAVVVDSVIPTEAAVSAIRTAQIHKSRVVLSAKLPRIDRSIIQSLDWPVDFYNADVIELRFKGFRCSAELGAGGEGDLKFIGAELVAKGAKCVVISLGWNGALVIDRQGPQQIPGIAGEVIDLSGCDAAFSGALTACLATGDDPVRAVRFAVAAEYLTRSRFGLQDSLPKKEDILTVLQAQPD
jgi:ribokinase